MCQINTDSWHPVRSLLVSQDQKNSMTKTHWDRCLYKYPLYYMEAWPRVRMLGKTTWYVSVWPKITLEPEIKGWLSPDIDWVMLLNTNSTPRNCSCFPSQKSLLRIPEPWITGRTILAFPSLRTLPNKKIIGWPRGFRCIKMVWHLKGSLGSQLKTRRQSQRFSP